jgi:hypothetical protein
MNDNYCTQHSCVNPHVKRRLPRAQMPQFTRTSVKQLDTLMRKAGHTMRNTRVSPRVLRPSQKEISISIANKVLQKWEKNKMWEPLLISSDFSILDGHHRWLAMVAAMNSKKLPATYKANVRMYSSPGRETLRLAKTIKTPRHRIS